MAAERKFTKRLGGIFVLLVLAITLPAAGAVSFSNQWQVIEIRIWGDGELLVDDQVNDNWGTDTDLEHEYLEWNLEARGGLKTAYEPNRISVDGWVDLWGSCDSGSPYEEQVMQVRVYYQTVVTVTDEPVWLQLNGYLTPAWMGITDREHFFVGSPAWYWWAGGAEEKIWMLDTACFDVGEHYFYGGVDYTASISTSSDWVDADADYYFEVKVVSEPVFEPSMADFDHSGQVDLDDFALFAGVWLWQL